MNKKILDFLSKIRSTEKGYKIASKILGNSLVSNNTIYQYFYNRKIKRGILELDGRMPGIEIGITNKCNADCMMCPHRNIKKFGTMTMVLYKKIIDDAYDCGIKSVNLTFFGEPMLDPELEKKVEYTVKKGLKVSFFTNASLMTKKRSVGIIKAGVDSITVSMDSMDKKTYEGIRRNLKYETVKKNILDFLVARKELGSDVKINMTAVLMDENYGELKEYYKFWETKVDNIYLVNMQNRSGSFKKKSKRSLYYKKGLIREPCRLLWSSMVIDWNGDVVLCCNDYMHEVVLGNLKNESIKEIWFGEKIKKIRDIHRKRCFSDMPFCDKCNKRTIWWLC